MSDLVGTVQKPTLRKTRAFRLSNERVLQLLTLFFSVIAVLSTLFMGVITRSDELVISKAVSLTGVNLLTALIHNMELNVYSFGTPYVLKIPAFVVVVLGAFLALQIGAVVAAFFPRKGRRISGYLSLISMAGMAVFFLVAMLSSKLRAENFWEENVAFYKIFSFGLGYVVSIFASLFAFICGRLVQEKTIPSIKKFWFLYLLLIIPVILIIVLSYYPILLQTVLSFKDYRLAEGIWGSDWVGLQHFQTIFKDPGMGTIIWNTVYISFIRLIAGLLPPIILALMIFEVGNKFVQKSVQTITYIPHFFSWVIIYGIVFAFLAPDGAVNNILRYFQRGTVDFLTNESAIIPILIISSIWKELGWSTIIYLASLTGIDTELYDAAAVDGVNPLQKLWYITLPEMKPVIAFLTIIAVGNLLKGAGGDQILIFANNAVMNKVNVIDTWLYWQGLSKMQYGLGAAVSFFQSGIGLIMVLAANKVSIKFAGRGLW